MKVSRVPTVIKRWNGKSVDFRIENSMFQWKTATRQRFDEGNRQG